MLFVIMLRNRTSTSSSLAAGVKIKFQSYYWVAVVTKGYNLLLAQFQISLIGETEANHPNRTKAG